RGGRAWRVVRRVIATTRSYACVTQAGLTRLGSNVMCTSRVVLRVRARRATTASLFPWRGLVTRQHRVERCPEKPVPIAGAQLCPWNARRVLYQKVGNFVGSVISPVLANMALDGLERILRKKYPHSGARALKGMNKQVNLVRYADDFIITGLSKEVLEEEVKPLVMEYLQQRGLELSEEKTRTTHIEEGFDFLGQNVRKYNGHFLITPSKKNVKTFLTDIRKVIKDNKQATAYGLIATLNPKIRGWANYHQHANAKKTFVHVDTAIFKALWQWAKRRHPKKGKRWVKDRYFGRFGNQNWRFFGTA